MTEPHAPHVAVVTYPDDKPRTMEVMLQPLDVRHDYQAQTGVFTGDEYPLSNAMQEQKIVFWPQGENMSFVFMTVEGGRPAAVKTGTTNDYYDGWTVGFTPQYVTAVWVGNTDHTKMRNASGVHVAGPIWHAVMESLHEGLPVEGFVRPEGIETAIVDSVSGKLPTEYSAGRMQEVFMTGTVPTTHDDVHRPIPICKESGRLATPYCPPELVERRDPVRIDRVVPVASGVTGTAGVAEDRPGSDVRGGDPPDQDVDGPSVRAGVVDRDRRGGAVRGRRQGRRTDAQSRTGKTSAGANANRQQ